jgi:Ca2+/H+ antiporter
MMLNLYRLNIQVPLCVIIAWIMGINMDLDFNMLETSSLAISIIATAFTLQVLISISQKASY